MGDGDEDENEEGEEEKTDENENEVEDEDDTLKKRLKARSSGPFAQVLRSKGFMWLATRPLNMGEWSQAGAILVVKNNGPWMCTLSPDQWDEDQETVIEKFSDIEEMKLSSLAPSRMGIANGFKMLWTSVLSPTR